MVLEKDTSGTGEKGVFPPMNAPVLTDEEGSGTGGRNYCNLNTIGMVYLTETGCPFCIPGSHLGILPTTRTASASSDGDTLRKTLIFDKLPSLLITICMMTLPCSLLFER